MQCNYEISQDTFILSFYA